MSFVETIEKEQVAFVTLNRPDVRNAFDPVMIAEITHVFAGFAARPEIKVVVLRGEGKVFCAGADLHWMKEMIQYTLPQNEADSIKLHDMFEAIYNCPVPVIGLVQGAAFGGALGLVAACDYVIADPAAQFCFSEVKLGLVPAVISTFILRKASAGKVRHAMMSGTVLTSAQVLDMGLVHEVAGHGDFELKLQTVLKNYNECGPEAVRATKKMLNDLPNLNGDQQKLRTTKLIAERRVSSEGQEGLKSFLEKRNPSWRSRS